MGRASIDYKEAERRYVIEEKSVRQISKEMGLRSWSSMNAVAKRDDWAGKRAAYHASVARRSYENAAAGVADQKAEITNEAILAGRLTLRVYMDKLTKGDITPTARDAQLWAAYLTAELASGARSDTDEAPNVRNVTPADAADLRRVVEAARGRVAAAGDLGPAPLVLPAGTRTN